MKYISGRFKAFRRQEPLWGSYIVLSKAVRGMRYGKMKINQAFNKYVPPSDFDKDEKEALLENLYRVTNEPMVSPFLNEEMSQTSLILSH